jgi:aminopeptidase-like protein
MNIDNYLQKLWPINRSLTGDGNRDTINILKEIADIQIYETPSGTSCFDWVVPPEWNVQEAWIKDINGNEIINFKNNNLHLLGYSEPFNGKLNYDELAAHLYTKPSQPDAIPYLTSYYQRRWGFCMSYNEFQKLDKNTIYEVFIDSNFNENGGMTWGEAIIPGKTNKEIFISTYICHPSMANDVISGMLGAAMLYKKLKERGNLNFTYRFIWIPETIGSINYLAIKGAQLKENMLAGFVLTCLADNADFTYKRSREKESYTNKIVERVIKTKQIKCKVEDFWPGGSDERQYCSPGFNLPVGSLMRTRYEKFPEYHTSADNLEFISAEALEKTIELYLNIIAEIENNPVYISQNPNCEPLLGKRGLYPTLGAQEKYPEYIDAMMWILNLCDGKNDLKMIAEEAEISLDLIEEIADKLETEGLIKKI